MRSAIVAYILWLPGLVFICGLHRLYAGKTLSGLVWLFTCGLLGFGQLIDLVLIPSMIDSANYKNGNHNYNHNRNTNTVIVNVSPEIDDRRNNPFDY